MPMSSEQLNQLFDRLESIPERDFQWEMFLGGFGEKGSEERERVEDWLRIKSLFRSTKIEEATLKETSEANRLAREANTNALSAQETANSALRTARQERTAACVAAIAAIIAAIVAIIK